MIVAAVVLAAMLSAIAIATARSPLIVWALWLVLLGIAVGTDWTSPLAPPTGLALVLWSLPGLALAVVSIPALRRTFIVAPAFRAVKRVLPRVSETEQAALEAGTVGFDAQFFSGRPDWSQLAEVPPIVLTDAERAFLDGPTEQLCAMIDDWAIRHGLRDIPEPIWDFVKRHGFLGMLISKEHGGLGFSAQAQSLILGKIASRSPDVSTIVMVPNSLGPGELIEKYGTTEQKHVYLPRLARGDEIPCFALTGPRSGSDAATMRDIGTVAWGEHEGERVLGIRLTWRKRYITLGPKATLLGLAFDLFDPDQHLGLGEHVGVTVALIPATHPGVEIGRRHLPCGAAFPNGPNAGTDVFIPISFVVGGAERCGQGWRMLMECLAAGRAISLPASAAAGAKAMLRFTSAYAGVRKQFGIPIARMRGIEEPLARMVEIAYTNEAARAVTAAMVSRGERPAVISALMKYQTTERLRQAVNDAMDIHGGRAICDGPSNYLQSAYQMVPVGITVEGANVLTRSLITFAQGALRSHPYLYEEIRAARDPDPKAGLERFERLFLDHVSFSVSNLFGSLWHNLTGGIFAGAPAACQDTRLLYKQLSRSSRNFALVADTSVALIGGGLKTEQRITGRLADALSELYILACVLKRYEDDGRPEADRAIVAMVFANGLSRFEHALTGAIANFPIAPMRPVLRWVVFPFGRHYHPAPDHVARDVVRAAVTPGAVRDRLTRDVYVSQDINDPTGLLEIALKATLAAGDIEKRLDHAVRAGTIRRYHGIDWFADAVATGVITPDEATQLRELEALTDRVIAVDDFDPSTVARRAARSSELHGTAVRTAAE